MIFLKRIAQLRKEKGLNQTGLALKLNITQYMVSAYENGRNQPSVDVLIQLADFFNVSVDYLLERSDVRTTITRNDERLFSKDEMALLNNYNALNEKQKEIALIVTNCLKHHMNDNEPDR